MHVEAGKPLWGRSQEFLSRCRKARATLERPSRRPQSLNTNVGASLNGACSVSLEKGPRFLEPIMS